MNDESITEPAARQWVKPTLEIVPLNAAMAGTSNPDDTNDGPDSYT